MSNGVAGRKKNYGERLEIRGVGKKVFGDAFLAMLFGVSISGAVAETGKAVFFLYLHGNLRNAYHDRYKKSQVFKKSQHVVFSCVRAMGISNAGLGESI